MATRVSQFRTVTPALVEQRRAPRFRVTVTRASVARHGEEPIEAVLHDLSIYGCRLESDAGFDAGERLWLCLDGNGPIAACAVWNKDDYVGCRFDQAIGRALVRDLTLTIR